MRAPISLTKPRRWGGHSSRDDLQNGENQQILATMKGTYDSEVDVLRVLFSGAPIE